MNTSRTPSRIDFDSIDTHAIERILRSGDLDALTPGERQYFSLMEMVRGLRARTFLPGGKKIVTKAGIIKLLKSDAYGLTDWTARRVYNDSLNFFYSDEGVSPRAWAAFYADRLDKLTDLAVANGQLKEAKAFITEAAKLRGCYEEQAPEIPAELLDAEPVVVYATDPAALGASRADRKEVEAFIDSLPDIPEVTRKRVREDAGISRRDLMQRMAEDIKEFTDEE